MGSRVRVSSRPQKALEKSRAFLCLRLLFIGDIELLKTHVLKAQNTSETKNETNFHTTVTFLMHDCKFNVYSSIWSFQLYRAINIGITDLTRVLTLLDDGIEIIPHQFFKLFFHHIGVIRGGGRGLEN